MLKLGSRVLFIDNAAGGFSQLVYRTATKCNLDYIYKDEHIEYSNEAFSTRRWNSISCSSTKITIHLLIKKSFLPNPTSFQIKSKADGISILKNITNTSAEYKNQSLGFQCAQSNVPDAECIFVQAQGSYETDMFGFQKPIVLVQDQSLNGNLNIMDIESKSELTIQNLRKRDSTDQLYDEYDVKLPEAAEMKFRKSQKMSDEINYHHPKRSLKDILLPKAQAGITTYDQGDVIESQPKVKSGYPKINNMEYVIKFQSKERSDEIHISLSATKSDRLVESFEFDEIDNESSSTSHENLNTSSSRLNELKENYSIAAQTLYQDSFDDTKKNTNKYCCSSCVIS